MNKFPMKLKILPVASVNSEAKAPVDSIKWLAAVRWSIDFRRMNDAADETFFVAPLAAGLPSAMP